MTKNRDKFNESPLNNEQVINISETLGVRVKQLVDSYAEGNLSKFEKLTTVPRTTLDDCVKKRSLPKVDVVAKIKLAIPDVDLNWLLSPSDSYRGTNFGDKIWLVAESEASYNVANDNLRKELALTKENNTTLKEYNDMLKGQVDFLKAELAKAQQQ